MKERAPSSNPVTSRRGPTVPRPLHGQERENPIDAQSWSQAETAAGRILLADDDSAVRTMLGRLLKSEGYTVTFARTGCEAANCFMDDPPDLVLLDLNMPEKDGWEAFELMCQEAPMIPVVVITARPHEYSHALTLGVDALMEKPLNIPLLLESIQDLVSETEDDRTRRLTNPHFRTAFLDRRGPKDVVVGGAP